MDADERVTAILRDVADALVDGVPRRADDDGTPVDLDAARHVTTPGAEDGLADDPGTGTDESEQPDDLTVADLEGDVVDESRPATLGAT